MVLSNHCKIFNKLEIEQIITNLLKKRSSITINNPLDFPEFIDNQIKEKTNATI